ncbi:16343_t:CDS:10 [Dentiscutata heterogama]|uniref:16343_t:CDS:1 n=1 Tax=Dentiscutata heterogama TaxID=1316150 RepID=A0ACA9KU59_9GLOM|nr:16343_t:CDS:10 [Dentiscutata heterogama]
MVKTIEDKKKIIRSLINLILEATEGRDTLKCSHVSENLEQRENFNNDLENNEETNKQLSNSYLQTNVTTNTSQADKKEKHEEFQAENNKETVEPMTNYHQLINVISRELEQMTLANDNTQASVIESIQDNDYEEGSEVSNDDSPGWSECEERYRNKKELCEYCGCSVCKWKGDRDHILICDECDKGFHTRCLKLLLSRIPAGNWYCKECDSKNSKKSKCKMRLEYSSSDEIDNQSTRKIKKLKTKSDKKYKSRQDTLDSDSEDSQNIRKSSKKKKTSQDKKCELYQILRRIDETENVPITQSDTNNQQDKIKNCTRTDVQINGDPKPIIIYNDMPKFKIFREVFDKWIDFSRSLPVPIKIEDGDDIKIDQESGKKSQEINPEANNWNCEFSKGERIASHVYKILVELSTIYYKGKPAIIKNVMVAARLRVMTKDKFAELIKKIEEQEPADNNDYYKLSDENLKELENSF